MDYNYKLKLIETLIQLNYSKTRETFTINIFKTMQSANQIFGIDWLAKVEGYSPTHKIMYDFVTLLHSQPYFTDLIHKGYESAEMVHDACCNILEEKDTSNIILNTLHNHFVQRSFYQHKETINNLMEVNNELNLSQKLITEDNEINSLIDSSDQTEIHQNQNIHLTSSHTLKSTVKVKNMIDPLEDESIQNLQDGNSSNFSISTDEQLSISSETVSQALLIQEEQTDQDNNFSKELIENSSHLIQ